MKLRTTFLSLLAVGVLSFTPACSSSAEPAADGASALRGIDREQALAELDEVGHAIRAFYGPLEFKKTRFGFDLDAALEAARSEIQAGENEADRIRPLYELVAKLKDAHVSLSYPFLGDQTVVATGLPVILTPVESSAVVAFAAPSTGLTRGDVVVSIDGVSPAKLQAELAPLVGIGPSASVAHLTAVYLTQRPFYAPRDLQPRGPTAEIVVEHADGSRATATVPWIAKTGGLAGLIQPLPQDSHGAAPMTFSPVAATIIRQTTVLEEGASKPFFLTNEVLADTQMVEVTPKAETLATFGVTVPADDATAPDASRYVWMRAYKYKHGGKTILLVRIPSFIAPQSNYSENVGWLAALLTDQMAAAEGAPDVAVLDDTHNPGGNASYVAGLASLFAPRPIGNLVQEFHADRTWISAFVDAANQSTTATEQEIWKGRALAIESAIDSGNPLSAFLPLAGTYQAPNVALSPELAAGGDLIQPYPGVHWTKPVLVLHDELSGSGGDAFPALLQRGGVAKTFGHSTMGAGGSVEPVATLSFSRGQLNLTRGLMEAYSADGAIKLIEDDGVSPDFPYTHTLADFRGGFVGYVRAFSDVAVQLTP